MGATDQESAVAEVDPRLLPDPMSHPCGRCGKPSWFRLRSAVWAGTFFVGSGGMGHSDHPVIAAVYQCPGCEMATLFEFQFFRVFNEPRAALLRSFPIAAAIPWDELPDELRLDHVEAWSCHLAGQYRAATLVARGVLQKAVRLLTKVRGNLKEELDALVTEARSRSNCALVPTRCGSLETKQPTRRSFRLSLNRRLRTASRFLTTSCRVSWFSRGGRRLGQARGAPTGSRPLSSAYWPREHELGDQRRCLLPIRRLPSERQRRDVIASRP